MADAVDEQIHHYLFERTADGVVIVDSQGVIARINPAAAAMLGLTHEQACGQKPSVVFRNNLGLVNLFNRAGDQVIDVHLPRRRLALGIASMLVGGGRIVMLQDVTEQRKLDSRREELISRMAHDLRNPLMAMGGFAELIETMGELTPQQQHFVTRMRQTVSKLYDVAASLVDLAWIEAGLPMQHLPFRLEIQIAQAIADLSRLAQEHKITIAVSLQDPLPLAIGDPHRLYRVVYELLRNAILYSEPDHSVAVHAWGDGHDMYCAVADQGIGIADTEIHLVFDRLYRSNDARVLAVAGGGLGLTLAKKIVLRHGGDIWAASNLGEGSTFTFVLPAIRV